MLETLAAGVAEDAAMGNALERDIVTPFRQFTAFQNVPNGCDGLGSAMLMDNAPQGAMTIAVD